MKNILTFLLMLVTSIASGQGIGYYGNFTGNGGPGKNSTQTGLTNIQPAGIAQDGAVSGQVLEWEGAFWAPATITNGGGGGGGSTNIFQAGTNIVNILKTNGSGTVTNIISVSANVLTNNNVASVTFGSNVTSITNTATTFVGNGSGLVHIVNGSIDGILSNSISGNASTASSVAASGVVAATWQAGTFPGNASGTIFNDITLTGIPTINATNETLAGTSTANNLSVTNGGSFGSILVTGNASVLGLTSLSGMTNSGPFTNTGGATFNGNITNNGNFTNAGNITIFPASGAEFIGNGGGLTNLTGSGWQLSGNTSIPGGSYLGTTDGNPLSLKVDSVQVGLFDVNQNIVLGNNNTISGIEMQRNVIGGGFDNSILNTGTQGATVSGGEVNDIGAIAGFIGGGSFNTIGANGTSGTIPGGIDNQVNAPDGFAAGVQAIVSYQGSFVWSDASSPSGASDTAINQFVVKATGGVRFGPNTSVYITPASTNQYNGNGGGLTNLLATNINNSTPAYLTNSTNTIAGIMSGSFTGNGAGLTNVGVATNEILLAINGNDSTGQRGTGQPFLTPLAAIQAAQPGDFISVSPGLYMTETNLAKNNVTWVFAGPSCIFSNFADNAIIGSSNAMFTDIYGATNITIIGKPTLIYHTGTDEWNVHDHGDDVGATNAPNMMLFTNTNTTVNMDIDSMTYITFSQDQAFDPIMVLVYNAKTFKMTVNDVIEPFVGTNYSFDYPNGDNVTGIPFAIAFLAENVTEWQLDFGHIYPFDDYSFNWIEPAVGTFTNNYYLHGKECNTLMYGDAHDNTYRLWANIDWLNILTSPDQGEGAVFFGGFNYLNCQKISSSLAGGPCVSVDYGATLWLTSSKIESSSQWIQTTANTNLFGGSNDLFCTVQQFSDSGGVNNGIQLLGGSNTFYGGNAVVSNGIGVNISGQSENTFYNFTVDTSSGSGTNKWPMVIATNGTTLNNVTLTAPAGTFDIESTVAASVGVLTVTTNTSFAPLILPIGSNYSANFTGNGAGLTNLNFTNAIISGATLTNSVTNVSSATPTINIWYTNNAAWTNTVSNVYFVTANVQVTNLAGSATAVVIKHTNAFSGVVETNTFTNGPLTAISQTNSFLWVGIARGGDTIGNSVIAGTATVLQSAKTPIP